MNEKILETANQIFRNDEFESFCIQHDTTVDAEIDDMTKEIGKILNSYNCATKTAKTVFINMVHNGILAMPYPMNIRKMLLKFVGAVIYGE